MNSIWSEIYRRDRFDSLQGTCKTDVLIVGGGLCGLLTAYLLQRRGVDCVLCEAERICSGVTQDTTAKITLQHGLIYEQTLCRFGKNVAQGYLLAQKEAMEEYERLCAQYPCDYEKRDFYVYSRNDRAKIEEEVSAINALGGHADFMENVELPFSVAGALRIRDQAQFHPTKFALSIARSLRIFENTRVLELFDGGAVTEHGKIFAKKTVVATHFPFLNSHGMYFLKLYQHRSYVLGLSRVQELKGMYVDEAPNGLSFRTYDGLLLIGGGGHRTGKKSAGWKELDRFAARYYPNSRPSNRWSTQDCMTLDSLPYIGRYSKNTPNLFVATGFQKWGMSNSMVAARLVCDLVLEKNNPYAEVFNPSRSIFRKQLAVNVAHSALGLLRPTVPRCPHLGCALKYNPLEHSWDCPCHGSRFDERGKLIDNPANRDLKK